MATSLLHPEHKKSKNMKITRFQLSSQVSLPLNHSGCSEIELKWLFVDESLDTYCQVSLSFSSLLSSINFTTSSELKVWRS